MAKGPVLIDLEGSSREVPSVSEAPPVPDPEPTILPDGRAMQMAAQVAARPPSRLARFFWGSLGAILVAIIAASAWDFFLGWITRSPILGWVFAGLCAVFVVTGLILAFRELLSLRRLAKIDDLRHAAALAREANDLTAARDVTDRIYALYEDREELDWGRDRLDTLEADQRDAEGLLDLTDREILQRLDTLARREVEAAARQVATITALVPLALADVIGALFANLRMIRRIAEVYGGRTGVLGGWRLTRVVMTHLVATGAVAVGDDMLEPVLGGSILGKLSRRFGEGLVNGALTARVGVAAMEVCRPMAFSPESRPKIRTIVKAALTGLVSG